DMAVAVNPEDERYKAVIGKEILQPITGRLFKVVADEHADPALGSGVVKITPGHDFNDFEVGKRAGIKPAEMLNMFDAEARVVQTADGLVPDEFVALDRFVARERVVARMKELGFLIPHVTKDKDGEEQQHDAEPRTIQQPYGDRGGVPIEPWLTDQWYVNAEVLAKAPIEAVRSGAVEIVPKSWEKTFFNWMENIQPWCVSRQLWWGHRIPAWYAEDGSVFVAETEEAAQTLAGGKPLTRDNDVLDTWFSSALWPFATLGWPEDDALLVKHYPNDLLISGFDILFFWDARMMMMGQAMTGQNPWKRLYLHGLVRAADGQKMSKSKGNVVDPLGLIDKYGADALRFFMCAMESQGRDVKMDERRVEGYRNFATKLWNAARFCQSNGIAASSSLAAPAAKSAVNRWIVGEVVETLAELDKAMAELRFDAAANAIYHFVWDQFCDWYIELIKGSFDEETRAVAGWVLDQILVMLHPFMPFVTEELWSKLGDRAHYPLITAKWPEPGTAVDAGAKAEVEWLIALIGGVREVRAELNVPPSVKTALHIDSADLDIFHRMYRYASAIYRMARVEKFAMQSGIQALGLTPLGGDAAVYEEIVLEGKAAAQFGLQGVNCVIPLEGLIDIEAEKVRLTKALEASTKEAKSLEGRLSNPAFTQKAKPEAVEKARADHALHAAEAERLAAALARLG
ncbi:MAG TPA: valine--tRNA ligase, partial [Novosphingobium sp.]|nr:valine--tRNA ligase [Novosphingobium sp.]